MRATRSSNKYIVAKIDKKVDLSPKGKEKNSGAKNKSAAKGKSVDKPVENPQPTKKVKPNEDSAAKSKPEPAKSPAKEPAKEQAKSYLKTLTLKGSIPVDQYVSIRDKVKVYVKDGSTFAATLNQSNVQNNNNKFYIIQVLQHEADPNNFSFFTRWGRVGVPGQLAEFVTSYIQALHSYRQKLNEKIRGGYRVVEMNYEADDEKKYDESAKKKESAKYTDMGTTKYPEVVSTLNPKVQDLVRLIFDMKMMNNQMKEIGYDANKMPLGKLAKSSILKGYYALKGLMEEVKGKKRSEIFNALSNDFYSYIPHNCGFKNMANFILNTEPKIKSKLEMLQSLYDIQVFTKILDEGKISNDINYLDSNYLKLGTYITPLDPNSDTYKLLLKYVDNTHATTHTQYKLIVEEIYELRKDLEEARYKKEIGNKMLLWHGSRLTNFVGILSQGLRIAPPEAPVTGYMFGKGVYFADMVTKSANYCFTSRLSNTGLMLLCEVALGEMNEKYYADYYANLLPYGKMSTKGVGMTAPQEGEKIGDVFVPCGEGKPVKVDKASLLYNYFIVYDIAQIKSRFLFKMRFQYK